MIAHRFAVLLVILMPAFALADDAARVAELEAENAKLKARLFDMMQKVEELEAQLVAAGDVAAGEQPATRPVDAIAMTPDETADEGESALPAAAGAGVAKEWIVTIVSNEPIDPAPLREQLAVERARMPGIVERIAAAQARHDSMVNEQIAYWDYDSDGRRVQRTKRKHNASEISRARADVKRVQDEERQVKGKIARLERQIQEAASSRHITATLEDNSAVLIVPLSTAQAAMVNAIEAGRKYRISGGSVVKDGATQIRVRIVTPVP